MRDGGYTIYIAVLFSRYAESEPEFPLPLLAKDIQNRAAAAE